jgi:hypothetical protein
MRKAVSVLCLAGLGLAMGQEEKKITLFTAFDFGRVESGSDLRTPNDDGDFTAEGYGVSGVALSRTYVDVGFVQRLDEHYQINIGVGGVFWKSFTPKGGSADEKAIRFGPGISNANVQWFPNDKLDLTFGFFNYKYNMAAHNLGEYLFRTEAYPTIINTGGWSWVNSASYSAVGVKASYTSMDGKLKQDIGLFGEYFNSPIYDITPAYIATLKATDWLTVGGAGALHRWISPTPGTRRALTEPHAYRENFYMPEVQESSRYYTNIPGYSGNSASGYGVSYSPGSSANLDSLRNYIWTNEQSLLQANGINSAAAIPLAENADAHKDGRPGEYVTKLEEDINQQMSSEGGDSASYYGHPNNSGNSSKNVSFDLRAVKLVAFFEVDFNKALGWNEATMGKFNLYGEVAQLGLKNYPIFYTEMAQRRPMMLGFSVPTMVLNNLSFEMEYLKNPTVESIASTYDDFNMAPDGNFRYQEFKKDDFKWTVHASRKLSSFLSLYVQVANDHMRLKNGFAQPQYVPVTNQPNDWYWLTRIQWMI